MNKVTVCITSFNRPTFLCEAIESVIKQSIKPDDIIIFDNGSLPDVYKSVTNKFGNNINWVGSDYNMPGSLNFQRAINSVNSEFVLLLHDDDRIMEDYIKLQLEQMERDPSIIALSCNGYHIDKNGKRLNTLVLPTRDNNRFQYFKSSSEVALKYVSNSCIPFSPILYRTISVKNINFREEFGKVCDVVFLCDLADIGTVAINNAILYECRIHSEQDSIFFSNETTERLEIFLLSRFKKNEKKLLNSFNKSLEINYTARHLKNALVIFKKNNSEFSFFNYIIQTKLKKFRISLAIILIFSQFKKNILKFIYDK